MIFRQTTIDDLLKISKLHQEIFKEDNQKWFSYQLNNELFKIYVVEDDELLGYISYQVIEGDADMLFFGVKPIYQNQQIGTKLLEYSIIELKKNLVNKIALEVRTSNTKARKIYEKLGFKSMRIIKNYYTDLGEDGILYVWEG